MEKDIEISFRKLAIIFIMVMAFAICWLSLSMIKHRENTETGVNLGVSENVAGDKKQARIVRGDGKPNNP